MLEPLTILYEDTHCLAAGKPAPLPTQGTGDVPSLEALVKNYLRVGHHKATRVYLGIPHRLDRPVTGVVLFARNTRAAQRLAEQFAARQVRKVYWAIVEGDVQPEEGVWEDWLRKVPDSPRAERVSRETTGAKRAVLRYRRRFATSIGTLLEIELETGRTHQIRVQAASRGWPVVGDTLYGATQQFGETIALHARSLTFSHPIRYESITVTAPLPEAWQRELDG